MLNAYNTGKDVYAIMASDVYQLAYELCLEDAGKEAKERRGSMKTVLLGIMYGRQVPSIAEQLDMSTKQAQQLVNNFFQSYPNIKNYIDETIRLGRLLGYVTTIAGRRRRLPNLNSPNEFLRAEAERQGVNATIQGTSADITKKAMVLVYRDEWLRAHNCRIKLTIHDEIVAEVPKNLIEPAGERIRSLMVEAAGVLRTKMPIRCDVEVFESAWNKDGWKLKLGA